MSLKIALLRLEARVAQLEVEADLNPALGAPGGVSYTNKRIEDALPVGPRLQQLTDTVNKGQGISNQDARLVYRFDDCNPMLSGLKMFKGFCISSHGQFRMDQRGITVRKMQEFFFNLEKYLERNSRARDAQIIENALKSRAEVKWTDTRSGGLTVVFKKNGDSAKVITAYYKNKKDPKFEDKRDYSKYRRRR